MHFSDETENACVSKRYINVTDGRIVRPDPILVDESCLIDLFRFEYTFLCGVQLGPVLQIFGSDSIRSIRV